MSESKKKYPRCNISLKPDTREQLLQYAYEKHISGGISGAIEYIVWNDIKVKNSVSRGQITFDELNKKKRK